MKTPLFSVLFALGVSLLSAPIASAEPVANTVISAKIGTAVFSFEISHPETANCTAYVSPVSNNCQIPISYRVISQETNRFYGNGIILDESKAKVGFFGVTTFLDSPSPNWKSSSIYASMPSTGKITLFMTGTNDYTYQTVSQTMINLNVSTTTPIIKLFDFNPVWDKSVLEKKVLYSKYPLGNTTSMILGVPKKIRANNNCADIIFYLAPVDFTRKEQPASSFYKRYSVFSLEVWTLDGLKLGSIDSRDSTTFFAPTEITKVVLQACDPSIGKGSNVVLNMRFKAGIPIVSQSELQEFSENLTVSSVSASMGTSSKLRTITCTKGKLTKKVTAAKPKCPAGFKKK